MKNNKNRSAFSLLIVLLLLAGCKVFKTDEATKPGNIPSSYGNASDSLNSASMKWKEFFSDTSLTGLIDIGLKNNFDALIAMQRIEAERSNVRLHKGALLPSVSGHATAAQRKYGLYTMDGAGNISTEITPGQIVPIHLRDYYIGLQTSWEVDLWGKLRNKKKAAIARYLSSVEGKNLVITNLVSELANMYYELLALDNELDIIQETIKVQEEALSIVKEQKEAGVVNELVVKQFEAQLLNSEILEKEIRQRILESENRINFLLGRYPQPIIRDKSQFTRLTPVEVHAGIPSDLLKNRPDIRQAEYNLVASKADLKAAKAAFYPALNINGAYGFQAFKTGFLFTAPQSIAYGIVGGLTAPLINRSAIKAEFKNANAMQREALYSYQQSIINGYVEVYNEVARIRSLEEIHALRSSQVDVLTQSVETSSELFRSGRATYLEVLLTQRNALDSRLQLVDTKRRQYFAVVNIYKALGGGWQ
jgi:outer membrane protein, multidrug efflux system